MQSVSAFAPATIANVGSAFDVLGFAISGPGDTVTATRSSKPGVRIQEIEGDFGKLSRDPHENTAGVSVLALLTGLDRQGFSRDKNVGIDLILKKGLPIGSGMGSSSASTVAAVVAVNALLGAPLQKKELLPFTMEGERVACGTAHADNVAPALLGGFVLIRSYSPLDVITLPPPRGIHVTVISPELEVRTSDARKVLKKTVALDQAIRQWGNVAALISAVYQNDLALLGRSLEDQIIEPQRAPLIPGYMPAKVAAIQAGAAGAAISGSGPSAFALSDSAATAEKVGQAMQEAFLLSGVKSRFLVTEIQSAGATIISRNET